MISLKSLLTESVINEDIKKDIDKFIDKLNKQFTDQEYTISSGGGKYVRINHTSKRGGGVSAWGFIAVVDNPAKGFKKGDLLKAAGYNTPAKHARGNILNGDAKYDKYSPTYLKEELNEGLYFVGYNKGRGQGTGVFKDSYSSYKDAKKAVEKLEKERGGSYNQIAYYVADKDGKFVRESVNEAKPSVVGNMNASGPSKVLGKGGKVLGFVPDTPNAIATLIQDYPNVQAIEFKSPFFFDFNSYKSIKKGDKAWKELMSRSIDKPTKAALKKDFQLKESVNEAKSDYPVYHYTYTSAIQSARDYAEKKGYEIDDEDAFRKIGMGPRKPSDGKTNRFSIELTKNGKPQKKMLHIQVYGMGTYKRAQDGSKTRSLYGGQNEYELNCYIN